MQEQRHPLSRVMDGPGLLLQRLMSLVDLHSIDPEYILLAMAETDPDFINQLYPDNESLLRQGPRGVATEEAVPS